MKFSSERWDELKGDPVFASALGLRYKELREPRTRTQEVLATESGVTRDTIRRIEQGRAAEIGWDTFVAAAKAVSIEPEQLIEEARNQQGTGWPAWLRIPAATPVGRDDDRDVVIKKLATHIGAVLFGAPGQGKSTLARYVSESIGSKFRHGVHEVDLENERQIENIPRLIMNSVGQLDSASYDGMAGKSLLLILDGIDQLILRTPSAKLRDALNSLFSAMSHEARVIITCQSKFEKQELATLEVLPLPESDAVEFFHQISENAYRNEQATDVLDFVRGQLACHPLSIRIVARYGRAVGLPLAKLRRLWEDRWAAIAERPSDSLDARGLRASFELAFESLPEASRAIFLVLALLPDGISSHLASSAWGEGETAVYEALYLLRDRSLLEEHSGSGEPQNRLRGPLFHFAATKLMELHKLRGESAIKSELETLTNAIDGYFDEYVKMYAPQFGEFDTSEKNRRIRKQFHNIHASLDRRLEPSTDSRTLEAAQSVIALYWAYHNNLSGAQNPITSTEDALMYLEKARAVFVGNGQSGEARKCVYYIGNILWLRGEIGRAESYFRDVQNDTEISDEMLCDIERAFAHIEYKEGRIPVAVEKYLDVIKKADGKFPDCVSRCWVGLLDAYRKLGTFDEGISLYQEIAPKLHAIKASVASNIYRGHAYLLASSDQHDEAISEYRRALDGFRQNDFGKAHCWRGIGDILVKKKNFVEAEAAFEKAMSHYRDARKIPSLGVALVTLGRGRLRLAVKDPSGAIEHFRNAKKQLGRDGLNEPYELAVAHDLLGDALLISGEPEKASAEYRIAESYFENVGSVEIAAKVRAKIS